MDFEHSVEIAKNLLNEGSPKILSRPISMYSSYWVLYPDHTLAQHTNSDKDDITINILITEPSMARSIMLGSKMLLPSK
jgi:hypothetical protein